jgi:hypothetical protein
MTKLEVSSLLGEPKRRGVNRRGEADWPYGDCSARFSKLEETLVEVGFLKSALVVLKGIDLFHDTNSIKRIAALDGNIYEFYGFLVFLDLGITLTGFHDNDESQKALTVFACGRWDQFKGDPAFKRWKMVAR